MITVYLDESFDMTIMAVGGCIIRDSVCHEVSRRWSEVLSMREFQLEYFHAADFSVPPLSNWPSHKKVALMKELTQIIRTNGCDLFGCAVEISTLNRVARNLGFESINPYLFCVDSAIAKCVTWVNEDLGTRPIAVVLEKGQRTGGLLYEMQMRKDKVARQGRQKYGLSSIRWEPALDFIPLQMADLVAYEYLKLSRLCYFDKERKGAIRKSTIAIREGFIESSGFALEEHIEKTLREIRSWYDEPEWVIVGSLRVLGLS